MSRAYNAMAHLTFPTATLSVKPLHLDGRIEEKVNQSRGFGFPVVAASVADGMDLCGRRNVVIAVSFAEFAGALGDIYRSARLWERVCTNGSEKARTPRSSEVAQKSLLRPFSDDDFRSSKAAPTRSGTIAVDRRAISGIREGAAA